jgi:hypothetical protein
MKKAVFLLKYDLNWIGGVYYKLHLIRALRNADNTIGIVVYTETENIAQVQSLASGLNVKVKSYDISVPRGLGRLELFFRRKLNYSLLGLFDFDLVAGNIVFDYDTIGILRVVPKNKRVYWIPDLQDLFLPHLFSEKSRLTKKNRYEYLSKYARNLVFSSQDSLNSFQLNYPVSRRANLKTNILRFTVFHPAIDENMILELRSRFLIDQIPFYIVSNQFMAHKNHAGVVEAMGILKERNELNFKMVFTGKTEDPRDPLFFEQLRAMIATKGLDSEIIITGVIDRKEQLVLMKNAVAVIQPSFFEGWNSTVEDAKLLETELICSDIPVHREQLESYPAYFFNPSNNQELALILKTNLAQDFQKKSKKTDYSESQRKFGEEVASIFIH